MRIHVVVAAYLGQNFIRDSYNRTRAELSDLFSKHGQNAQAAAEDIWNNKEKYLGLTYNILPLSHFYDEVYDARYPEVEEAVRERVEKEPNTPTNKIRHELVNKYIIASNYLKYTKEWSRGQSELQQDIIAPVPLSSGVTPYGVANVSYAPGITSEEFKRDISEHPGGKKFASALIQAVVSRYLTASMQDVSGAYKGMLFDASSLRTFREIRAEYDSNGKHHCLKLSCGMCGKVQTCRCSTPKDKVTGICDKCEKSRA